MGLLKLEARGKKWMVENRDVTVGRHGSYSEKHDWGGKNKHINFEQHSIMQYFKINEEKYT